MQTTLEKIRAHSPCAEGWTQLLAHLGKTKADSTPLPLSVILESNGLEDTLWCFRAVDGFEREKRLFAVWCARQVQRPITDPRSLAALDVAEQFANDLASLEELVAARADVWDAAWAANAETVAAWAAAWAANAETVAAWAANADARAADIAAWAAWAAWAATLADAAKAANAAYRAASDASDASDAARASQTQELERVLACTEAGIDPYPPLKD